ncbi:MAG TPA: hypothetical protein VKR32_17240 [Puia sp.]|nr:hypothetical protein [Puia sp.]
MERLQELISKLKEQFEQNAPASQMLLTTQLIQSELFRNSQQPASLGTAKVAVVMPSSVKMAVPEKEIEKVIVQKKDENPEFRRYAQPQGSIMEPSDNWSYNNPMAEIPTLAQQQIAKEVNDFIGSEGMSLNEKLKGDVKELGTSLKHSPVQDLKKAIGINDRYLFISELFRGDEAMYERSIKTINNFRILAEAEYWIERELKVKLGWDNAKIITHHFYDVVKRRFA